MGRMKTKLKNKNKKAKGGSEAGGKGGGGWKEISEILFTATSTQSPTHKANKKSDMSKHLSKHLAIGEVERNYRMSANPVFIAPGRFKLAN